MTNVLTTDELLDLVGTVIDTPAKAKRREAAMQRAHAKGLSACEVCGRAIDGPPAAVVAGAPIGPRCARKLGLFA